jgi:hypothetical protein
MDEDKDDGQQREGGATFLETIKAVLWAFFGVRRGRDHERDAARLNPLHVVIAGVLAAATFVLILVLVVHQVVKS